MINQIKIYKSVGLRKRLNIEEYIEYGVQEFLLIKLIKVAFESAKVKLK